MKKLAGALCFTVVVALARGCGGNSPSTNNGNGGGGGAFPFSGPSCPPGSQPTMMPVPSNNAACQTCVQGQCDVLQCITTDCATYFSCACACQPRDLNCLQTCVMSGMTQACTNCIGSKIPTCILQTCGDACGLSSVDAGFAVQCSLLASCCAKLPQSTAAYNACQQTVNSQNDTACRDALAGYRDGGACP
jgi:hypothetical protein